MAARLKYIYIRDFAVKNYIFSLGGSAVSSWWEFAEDSGYQGSELNLSSIKCGFCGDAGHFLVAHHVNKKHPTTDKILNYDTLSCVNCGNYTMVFWASSGRMHDFLAIPWFKETTKYPEYWPKEVGRFWLQARRSIEGNNWDAAVVMARSALQIVMRLNGASGNNLKQEINDLAAKGLLPPIMVEWSHELREIGNDSAHPAMNSEGCTSVDAKDIVEFLTTMLTFVYKLPHQIETYRSRNIT